MTKLFAVLIVTLALLGSALAGDTLHVKSVHKASNPVEKTYRTAFNQTIYQAVLGNRLYTLEVLAFWGMPKLEVGQDYDVVKATDRAVTVRVHGKKHDDTLSLNVVTVEEAP